MNVVGHIAELLTHEIHLLLPKLEFMIKLLLQMNTKE